MASGNNQNAEITESVKEMSDEEIKQFLEAHGDQENI
jgi:hypothetical protein